MAEYTYQLVMRKGDQPGQIFPLVGDSINIGRDPLSDIVINDAEVSREHSRLTKLEDGYKIQDLGSTNGTFINGQRLRGEAVVLTSSQSITMGTNVVLLFEAIAVDPNATMVASADDMAKLMAELPAVPTIEESEKELAEALPDVPDLPQTDELVEKVEDLASDALPEMPAFTPPSIELPEIDKIDVAGTILDLPGEIPEMPATDDLIEKAKEVIPDNLPDLPEKFEAPSLSDLPDISDGTVIDVPTDLPDFSQPVPPPPMSMGTVDPEPINLPDFGSVREQTRIDTPQELPTYDSPPPPSSPPPPVPPSGSGMEDNAGKKPGRNRTLIIAVVALLLCCCCMLVSYQWLGDIVLDLAREQGINLTP